ncbi:CHAD domain-containing protein [Rhodopila sp.]|uniref:CYTH and CHAD domain-containing protein n=1 Tax=Rhodopila sp. TaxID=2480087 RepID=UPI003D0E3056
MELELATDAEAVATLSRLKPLLACRDGRPRSQALKIVWHDSPERGLLAEGMILAEHRGVQRLERVYPGAATWLPGQPVPVVAEAPDLAALPSPLAPLAAFEGRQTASVHQSGGRAVTVTVAKGILRSVTAERPAARIWLSGEEQAVGDIARLIAGAVPAGVPLTSLAADGVALATGRPAAARHGGAPELPTGPLSVADALMHILGHLIDVVLVNAPLAVRRDGDATEAVHQMRVAVRRARSAVSIFQGAFPGGALGPVNDALKHLSARLGPTRDWDVFAEETIPAIQQSLPEDDRLRRLIAAAERRRRESQAALAGYLESAAFRLLGVELAWLVSARFCHVASEVAADDAAGGSPIGAVPDAATGSVGSVPDRAASLAEFAGRVLQQRWKKLVSSGKQIDDLDIPSLHGVRLRAKRARYAAEMFATLYQGKASHRFIRRLSALQERLGVLNDGVAASHLLTQLGGPAGRHGYAVGLVTGFLAARAVRMRPRIVDAFERSRRQPAYWA